MKIKTGFSNGFGLSINNPGGARSTGSLFDKAVNSLSPWLWWKLNETSGTTAEDSIGSNDGTITIGAGSLGNAGAFAGDKAINFDGADTAIQKASFSISDAQGREGTMLFLCKNYGGYWSDGLFANARISVDASNFIVLGKYSNDSIYGEYKAGGTGDLPAFAPTKTTGWYLIALTWSLSNDRVIVYQISNKGGTVLSNTATTLGTFAGGSGTLDLTYSANELVGLISNFILFPTELTQASLVSLAQILDYPEPWYLLEGAPAPWAAWEFKGASSEAESLLDLVNSNNLTKGGSSLPTWDAGGWQGSGSGYLSVARESVIRSTTTIFRFSGIDDQIEGLFGHSDLSNDYYVRNAGGTNVHFIEGAGSEYVAGVYDSNAVLGIKNGRAYKNGLPIGSGWNTGVGGVITGQDFYILAHNYRGSALSPMDVGDYCLGGAIWDAVLTDNQMQAISEALALL